MLYDNALDDGPMLIDNPPWLEVVTKLYEDKDDILAVCSGTLTHGSPTSFLNSPNYPLEEKFAYVEKYLCGLQLPCVENPHCHHDLNNENSTINYFEKGKHANEYNDNYNDSLHKTNLHALIHSIVEFTSNACNYYERRGDKCPPYTSNDYMFHSPIDDLQRYASIYLVIYKIPMHRKKVRLRCYCFHILCSFLPCFNLNIILIGMNTL
jgi:hypothetical protein